AAAVVVGSIPRAWERRHRLRLRGASAGRALLLAGGGLLAVVIVAGLLEPRAKVEIEATAVVPD
ncbi:MAG: hypothetical protein ACLGIK_07170, partial [Gemmatimonadota bacterium]